jgi:hypothetical protein
MRNEKAANKADEEMAQARSAVLQATGPGTSEDPTV